MTEIINRPRPQQSEPVFAEPAAPLAPDEPQLKASPTTPERSDLELERLSGELSGYELTSKLGRGGFGAVYAARDVALDREVAIKVFTRESDPTAASRFKDEGRLLAKLHHPHIVQVYQMGTMRDGSSFLVMERFGGGSIKEHWPRGACPALEESVMIITQLLDALSAAHEVGVVHRDIKEANILYDATLRQIKLCDFGIARAVERLADQAKTTREGVIIGTEHYIAPERYQGRNHDLRSDLYSVGVIFYRLLTGHRPLERYAGEPLTPEMLIYRLFSEPIGGLDAVPTPIARVCERLLEVDATRRYQEASVAAQELAAALKAPAEIDHTGDSSSGSNAGFSAGSSSAPNSAFKALPLPGHIAPARALAPPLLDGEHAAQTQTARGLDARMSDGPQPWSVERRSLVRPLLFVMVGVLLMVCWTWYTGLKHDADIKTRGAGAIILKPKLTPKHTQSHTQSRTSRALRSTSGRKESAVGETSTRDRPRERSQETDRREIDRQTTRRRRLKRTPRRPQRGSRSRSSDESSPFIYPQAK